MLNEMHSLSLLRLKYLKKMHVKSCSLTLLNHTSPGQVPLRSSLLQGSRFWAGCVGEAERARECTYSLRWSLSFSFFLPCPQFFQYLLSVFVSDLAISLSGNSMEKPCDRQLSKNNLGTSGNSKKGLCKMVFAEFSV